MESQNTTINAKHGRHGKKPTASSVIPLKPKHEDHGKHLLPKETEWNFAGIGLGLSILAVLTGFVYSIFYVFNKFCPADAGGSCSKVPVGSFGGAFEIIFLVLLIALTIASALFAVEGIVRMLGTVKAYVTLAILTLMLLLISAAIPQELIEKAVLRFLA